MNLKLKEACKIYFKLNKQQYQSKNEPKCSYEENVQKSHKNAQIYCRPLSNERQTKGSV